MRIIQFLPTIAFGDAVGNDTIALKKALQEFGYETEIYAEVIDQRLPEGTAVQLEEYQLPPVNKDDIAIYHMSTGSLLNYTFEYMNCHKVLVYHNVTPPSFFMPYSKDITKNAKAGVDGIKNLAGKVEFCFADSEFNKRDLISYGFTCPIVVRPILIPFEDYKKEPSSELINKYGNDGYTNLIFVGRVAPNKKHEDIIAGFAYYKKHFNDKARLFLVGAGGAFFKYEKRLEDYVKELGLEESVIFTGHLKFNEILAYYKIASAFLCMSEHEGFCVPLTEAMSFDVPVIAYASTAIPYTLNGSGVLIDDKDPVVVADAINRVVTNEAFRTEVINGQRERLKDFEYDKIKELFKKQLDSYIESIKA